MPIELAEPAPGCPKTEWVLAVELAIIIAIVVIAAKRRRLSNLLLSDGTMNWFGGLLLFTSAFFATSFGPWGARMSPYTSLTWNWGFPRVLGILPVIYPQIIGFVVCVVASIGALSHRPPPANTRWWGLAACVAAFPFLLMVGLTLLNKYGSPPTPIPAQTIWIIVTIVIVASALVGLPLILTADDRKRTAWIHLGLSTLLLFGSLYSMTSALSRGEPLWIFRAGFWIGMAGLLLLVTGNARAAFTKSPSPAGHCRSCGYNLSGNVSGICPECGKPVPASS